VAIHIYIFAKKPTSQVRVKQKRRRPPSRVPVRWRLRRHSL